jgi:cytochrome b
LTKIKMGLSTQVSNKDRQAASHYPFPLTPILGVLSFISASVVTGVLAYFIHYLRMDHMSAPNELIFVRLLGSGAALKRLTSAKSRRWAWPP